MSKYKLEPTSYHHSKALKAASVHSLSRTVTVNGLRSVLWDQAELLVISRTLQPLIGEGNDGCAGRQQQQQWK